MDDELVMYCVFSKEAIDKMGGNRGKMAAMAGHAFLHAWWNSEEFCEATRELANDYQHSARAKKVVLVTDLTSHLYHLEKNYKAQSSLVRDAGLTVFGEPTVCCIGIGPIKKSEVGDDLKSLKVLI